MNIHKLLDLCCLFRIFDLFLLFFNDSDLFPYRFHDIYLKKPLEFNIKSAKRSNIQTKPNKHIMADDFGISELVTLAGVMSLVYTDSTLGN